MKFEFVDISWLQMAKISDSVRVKSYFAMTVSQSVSQLSFAMIPYGSHDQILVAVKKIAFLFVVERSLCREGESVI
jgi:hypothetical protein